MGFKVIFLKMRGTNEALYEPSARGNSGATNTSISHTTVEMREISPEARMNAVLAHPDIIAKIRTLRENDRAFAVERLVQYLAHFEDMHDPDMLVEEIAGSLDNLMGLGIRQISKHLGFGPDVPTDLEERRLIIKECFDRFRRDGCVFHGFNGTFESTIRQEGLNPQRRAWEWRDLQKIHDIGTRLGREFLLGWGMMSSSRSHVFV
jgi:hypothetical protein